MKHHHAKGNDSMFIGRGLAAVLTVLSGGVSAQPSIPTQEAKLIASDLTQGTFGYSVALSGDTAVVGDSQGSAYVFIRTGGRWIEQAKLIGIGPVSSAFGHAVAISGDTAVVGDYASIPQSSNGRGSAFVFQRHGSVWTQQAVLSASDAAPGASFGEAVAISGDIIAVGDWLKGKAYIFERTGQTWSQESQSSGVTYYGDAVAVSGDTVMIGATLSSTVSVFSRIAGTWTEQPTLTPTGSVGAFGERLALSGDTAAIGGWDYGLSDGTVHVFVRTGGSWSLQAILAEPEENGGFFESIAVSDDDDVILVGLPEATASGQHSAGLAYLYVRTGTSWAHQGTLKASDASANDDFGRSVAVSEGTAIVGAWLADTPTTNTGAAYVFHPVQPWGKLGGGLSGFFGIPQLEGSGTLEWGSSGSISLTKASHFTPSVLFVSVANNPTPFKSGSLSTVPVAFQLPISTFFTGAWTLPWGSWPAGIPAGAEMYFQVAVSDASAINGVSISNLLKATQP